MRTNQAMLGVECASWIRLIRSCSLQAATCHQILEVFRGISFWRQSGTSEWKRDQALELTLSLMPRRESLCIASAL